MGFALGLMLTAAMLAGGAAGKAPPEGIEICGQNGCKRIAAAEAELIVIRALDGSVAEPAAPAPHFLVRWAWPGQPEQRAWWVPRGGLVRAPNSILWKSQSVTSEAMLRRAAAGLVPFSVPSLSRVLVGGRVAENPQSYLRLLGAIRPTARFEGARGWIEVRLTSLESSPWTNGATWLQVSRSGGFLRLDAVVHRIPPALAERARRGRSLTPFTRAG